MMRFSFLGVAWLMAVLCALTSTQAEEATPDFNEHVLPILNKYCSACHSADDPEGKLGLHSFDAIMQGGEHGAAITPGRSETSRLIRLVTRETKPFMPPDDSEAPKPAEIEVLRRWIDAGAKGPSGAPPDPTKLVTPKIPLKAAPRASINQVAASPTADILAVARYEVVELIDRTSGEKRLLEGHVGNVHSVAFSHDGRWLVAAAGEPGLFGEAKLWNVADGSLVKSFRGHKDALLTATLSPDGTLLATGSYDHTVLLWNVESGEPLATLEGHNGAVYDLAFHASGNMLATASGDRTVKLWSVPDGARLDTLKESTKELYALAFHPSGEQLAGGGVDNRIRVWQIHPEGRENGSPLIHSKFAHEQSILRLAWSLDGKTLVSSGEDALVNVWNASDLSHRKTLESQSDWPVALALSSDASEVHVGRLDGTLEAYDSGQPPQGAVASLSPLPEVPPEVDYGPQPAIEELPMVNEVVPNDLADQATPLSVPGIGVGRIFPGEAAARQVDVDLWRFTAKKDDQWILETNAARSGSPLDSKIEVLDAAGSPVPRLLLRAVRNTSIEFRGASSEQRGFRLEHWEEMLLNEYVWLNGEVIKHFMQRRGPDADGQFYPENGSRIAYFDTTAIAHALEEPGYVVVPYPLGTELPNNGLPVFTLNFENDDDSSRKLGKDSRLTFVAPADGEYLVRVSDVRGFSGENFNYQLVVRRPQPDFKVTLTGGDPAVNAGSGKAITVKAERIDNFMGPIRVDIEGLPPGFSITTPIEIPAGLYEAQGVINALPGASEPTAENMAATKVSATAMVAGKEVQHEVNNLGTLKLAARPKVIVHLEREDAERLPHAENEFPPIPEIEIVPGEMTRCRLRVERHDFKDRIQFDVPNLPHGVIVDDIGLNGVLLTELESERTLFLRAEPWVPEQARLFFATAQVDGNQSSLPMRIVVKRRGDAGQAAVSSPAAAE
jgi:hypothetical protein